MSTVAVHRPATAGFGSAGGSACAGDERTVIPAIAERATTAG